MSTLIPEGAVDIEVLVDIEQKLDRKSSSKYECHINDFLDSLMKDLKMAWSMERYMGALRVENSGKRRGLKCGKNLDFMRVSQMFGKLPVSETAWVMGNVLFFLSHASLFTLLQSCDAKCKTSTRPHRAVSDGESFSW